jgi:hypothetical protein
LAGVKGENAMRLQKYSVFLKTHKLITDAQQTEKILQVGRRIQKGIERYFPELTPESG